MIRLGDLISISSGGTPKRDVPEYFENGTIPWVKTGDLKGKYVNFPEELITQEALNNSSAKVFPKRTVLLAMYGATIGACSILDFEAATNQACAALLPTEKVDENYLFYYLSYLKPEIIKMGVGGAQPNISASIIKDIKIPLPPLSEQKRIAELLDAADNLRKKDKALLEKYDQLAQSLFLEMFGDPVKNEKGWEVILTSEICEIVRGSSPRPKGDPRFYGAGVPRLMVADLTRDGKFVSAKIDSLTIEGSKKSRFMSKGELVMAVSGKPGVSAILMEDCCIHDGFAGFKKVRNNFNLIFLQEYYSQYVVSIIAKSEGAIFQNITTEDIRKIRVFNVNISLQNEFAEKVQLIEKQKEIAKQNLEKSEELMKGLMGRVFG